MTRRARFVGIRNNGKRALPESANHRRDTKAGRGRSSGATLATSVYDRMRDDLLSGGLKPGEKVIYEGLQKARDGAAVNPTVVDIETTEPEKKK